MESMAPCFNTFVFVLAGDEIDIPVPGCICLHFDPRFNSWFIYRVNEVRPGDGGIGIVFSHNWQLLADRVSKDYALGFALSAS